MAHGYRNILEAVQGVKNPDTGYDAARDCTVVFISPPYGVDSQRSGMGSDRVDPVLNWNKTLEYWNNVLLDMPRTPNLEVGFREIFAGPENRQWMEVYRQRMESRGLNPNVFLFFLGGADQYSNGSFNDPVTGSAVMNGLFDGAEAIYNFNGGLHQEAQQVINAEYSWNSHAPGRLTPTTFRDGLQHWHALMKDEERPPAVFGPHKLFAQACGLLYGPRAGASVARYFLYQEDPPAGDLPAFYPSKLHPLIVLWRFLEGDRAYWDREPSAIEKQSLAKLNLSRAELQARLAEHWRRTAAVNEKAGRYLEDLPDLRTDARQDIARLRLSNQVGWRMARLVAAYHDLLAGKGEPGTLLTMNGDFQSWLRNRSRFDFTDPKGGDASSWLEAAELLRAHLLEASR